MNIAVKRWRTLPGVCCESSKGRYPASSTDSSMPMRPCHPKKTRQFATMIAIVMKGNRCARVSSESGINFLSPSPILSRDASLVKSACAAAPSLGFSTVAYRNRSGKNTIAAAFRSIHSLSLGVRKRRRARIRVMESPRGVAVLGTEGAVAAQMRRCAPRVSCGVRRSSHGYSGTRRDGRGCRGRAFAQAFRADSPDVAQTGWIFSVPGEAVAHVSRVGIRVLHSSTTGERTRNNVRMKRTNLRPVL